MQDLKHLPSREELLAIVDKLNYHQRIHYAATLGKTHKESPHLKELIESLRKVTIKISNVPLLLGRRMSI